LIDSLWHSHIHEEIKKYCDGPIVTRYTPIGIAKNTRVLRLSKLQLVKLIRSGESAAKVKRFWAGGDKEFLALTLKAIV